jgi:methylthioribose-1-phosphate isomerase
MPFKTIQWIGGTDGHIELIDQTALPNQLTYLACHDVNTLWEAIRSLRVRGAPAIGVAAAMGVLLGIRCARTKESLFEKLIATCEYLAGSRPTAVNLFWALDRMKRRAELLRQDNVSAIQEALLAEARLIRDEDAAMCRAIGKVGQALIRDGAGVLTHCNAGGLATSEYGTALAVMYAAHELGRRFQVFADETRPLLQGSRLTAWELLQAGIDVTVICDNMAAVLMKGKKIDVVVTGADRVASNGDAANKIGTYGLAVLAKAHDIPFYVACPSSTFDLDLQSGDAIPIEQRPPEEISRGFGQITAPEGVRCYNPAFDVTPARLIAGIITEKGMIQPVCSEKIREIFSQSGLN